MSKGALVAGFEFDGELIEAVYRILYTAFFYGYFLHVSGKGCTLVYD